MLNHILAMRAQKHLKQNIASKDVCKKLWVSCGAMVYRASDNRGSIPGYNFGSKTIHDLILNIDHLVIHSFSFQKKSIFDLKSKRYRVIQTRIANLLLLLLYKINKLLNQYTETAKPRSIEWN